MRAGGLGRNPRRKGKLAGGQGSAIEKRREHRSSRRLPDQRRDLRDERACNHLACIACRLIGRADEQFDGGRSEVLSSSLALTIVAFRDRQSCSTLDVGGFNCRTISMSTCPGLLGCGRFPTSTKPCRR